MFSNLIQFGELNQVAKTKGRAPELAPYLIGLSPSSKHNVAVYVYQLGIRGRGAFLYFPIIWGIFNFPFQNEYKTILIIRG